MGKEPLAAIREREIYARIDRILCHKHIEFALEHQKDSLEQLTEYLKACTDDLGHALRRLRRGQHAHRRRQRPQHGQGHAG